MGCVADMRSLLGGGSEAAVEAAILHRLGHVLRGYPLTSIQVSDSAGDLEDAVVTARGKAQAAHRLLEEPGALGRWRTEAAHLASAHPGVHAHSRAGQARALTLACGLDPRADGRRGLTPSRREIGIGHGGHLEVEIDPVEEWTGEPGEVLLPLPRRADAGIQRGAAAATGVGRAHELEASGEGRTA